MSRPIYLTATGNVGDTDGGAVRMLVLTPAAALSTLVLREGGSGGSILVTLQAAASGNSVTIPCEDDSGDGGMVYSGQLHVTLTGTGAVATIGV